MITQTQLDELKLLPHGTSIRNVSMFCHSPRNGYGNIICVPNCDSLSGDNVETFDRLVGQDAFFIITTANPKYNDVKIDDGRWACNIVYAGFGYTDFSGRTYPVDTFYVHPIRKLR